MKHGKMMGMPPMMHGMMESMVEKSVMIMPDGGVLVVMGNKLSKFDKDLNLIKEVTLTVDTEGMKKMMSDMKEICPMMPEKGMDEGKESVEEKGAPLELPPADTATPAAEPVGAVDHESHH
ncbi:MAG: hypothetical protein NUV91_04915, partial [Candidatus Omnitrophica bacterium]|nr:hypothetical protein [Candidatus Omnitrophota bacterium]